MTSDPISISATAYMVISELIGNSVTCRAAVGWVMEGDTKPIAAEFSVLYV